MSNQRISISDRIARPDSLNGKKYLPNTISSREVARKSRKRNYGLPSELLVPHKGKINSVRKHDSIDNYDIYIYIYIYIYMYV